MESRAPKRNGAAFSIEGDRGTHAGAVGSHVGSGTESAVLGDVAVRNSPYIA